MRHFYPALIFLFSFSSLLAGSNTAPVNDDPCSATFIGQLDTASGCPFSSIVTPLVLTGQSNAGATPEFPHPALLNCLASGDMPATMKDVWYKFIPSASTLDVFIFGSGQAPLANPVAALYLYTGDCMALTPVRCALGQSGMLNANCPVVPGAEYLLQVGGSTASDAGEFTLILGNSENCLSCSQEGVLFANPPPVNGYYNENQVVDFCYVLNGYKRYNGNSLHGVVPVMGPAWDPASYIYYPVQRTTNTPGNWISYLYNNLPNLGSQTGFFFDASPPDGDPRNNTGDAGGLYDTWMFCWQAKTQSCPIASKSLNIAVHLFSDGITGQGAPQPGCVADKPYDFSAVLNCCGQTTVAVQPESCLDSCNGSITLSFSSSVSFLPTYNFNWFDANGSNVQSSTLQTSASNTYTGACSGIYTAIVSSNSTPGCFIAQNVKMDPPFHIQDMVQNYFPCGNTGGPASATAVVVPNTGNYLYSWSNGGTNATATNLQPGQTYTVAVTDGSSCVQYDTITPVAIPNSDPYFEYPSQYIAKCSGGALFVDLLYVETPGGVFMCSTPGVVAPATGQISVANTVVNSTYTIVYTTPGPCPSTDSVRITITGQDTAYFHYPRNIICSTDLNPLIPDSVLAYGGYFHVVVLSGPQNGLQVDSASGVASPIYQPGVYVVIYESVNPGACHATYQDTITILAPPSAPQVQSVYYYCAGDSSLTITATNTCITCVLAWCSNPYFSPPDFINTNTITINPSSVSTYYLIAYDFNTNCTSNVVSVNIQQASSPVPTISASDTAVCPGYVGYLHANPSSSGYSYSWVPSSDLNNSALPDPQFTASITTTYTLYVTDLASGCSGTSQFTVTVDSTLHCDTLIFYSGFSPNGDNMNDAWIIDGIALYPSNKVFIFNRWGEKVWEAAGYNNHEVVWLGDNMKGKALPPGTYYYVVEISGKKTSKGWVELTK